MNSQNTFTPFYPTSSSTMLQHGCVRLLWLPLSACLKTAGEHARSLSMSSSLPPLTQRSVATSFARGSAGSLASAHAAFEDADDDLVSGFELRFKRACMAQSSTTGEGGAEGEVVPAENGMLASTPSGSGTTNSSANSSPLSMRNFKECFLTAASAATSTASRGATAPATPPHYREDARLKLLIGEDTGASSWENMDMFRVLHGVIVVVNTACALSIPLHQVLEVVKTVFSAQYRDTVCRCFIVAEDPSSTTPSPTSTQSSPSVASIVSKFPSRTFVAMDLSKSMEQLAREALESIGRDVVFSLNARLAQCDMLLASLSKNGNKAKFDHTVVRTPLDMTSHSPAGSPIPSSNSVGSGSLESLKAVTVASRVTKKKGDLYLQLGAGDFAVKTYGETQFGSNVDSLWCSSTLESIAGARYQEWQHRLVPLLPAIAEGLIALQSNTVDWADAARIEALLRQIENVAKAICADVQKTLASFKGNAVPNSMRQRLVKEIEEPLTAKSVQLRALLARARACVEAGTNELPADPLAYRVGTDLKVCVESMISIGLSEIDVYLKESLRQLRHAVTPANKKLLQDRDLEARMKIVSLLVDRGATETFLSELSVARSVFSETYGDVVQKVLRFFAYLCVKARCWRKAVSFLVETAYNDRKSKLYGAALQALVRACFLSGIALGSVPELNAIIHVDPLCLLFVALSQSRSPSNGILAPATISVAALAGAVPASGAVENASGVGSASFSVSVNVTAATAAASYLGDDLHPEQGTNKRTELALSSRTVQRHIPLLVELLEVLQEAQCGGSVRCQLASMLLFRYSSYLSRQTAQALTDIARSEASQLSPHVRPSTAAIPFLASWEALPLPPHLAPKTVSVGGPFFTFIDTQRLKLTVLSLNGRRLNSRVVWAVGDVGSVMILLFNPFPWRLRFISMALQCRSCSDLDEHNNISAGAASHAVGPLAPTCYVLSNVTLEPYGKRRVQMQVQPKMEGFLRIEGVELRVDSFRTSSRPIEGKLPEPMGVPVLQQLPLVSCTVSLSEVEIFSGQCIDFSVRVVNCGQVPIAHIKLTAHGEACQLEDCEGCKERASKSDVTVLLSKAALEAASRVPLRPGDVVTIPVHMQAPPSIDTMEKHFVIFRVDCSLPHDKPTMPPNVPSAVPVFGVIPRRVTETRMRVFHAPTLAVTSVRLTKDKRFVDIRILNRSERYSVGLQLSALNFADLPDALLMAGADYVVPPIDIGRVSDSGKSKGSFVYEVPWAVREIPNCGGTLHIDFGLVSEEVVCTEPLDEVLVSLAIVVPSSDDYGTTSSSEGEDRSTSAGTNQDIAELTKSPHTPPQHHHWESCGRATMPQSRLRSRELTPLPSRGSNPINRDLQRRHTEAVNDDVFEELPATSIEPAEDVALPSSKRSNATPLVLPTGTAGTAGPSQQTPRPPLQPPAKASLSTGEAATHVEDEDAPTRAAREPIVLPAVKPIRIHMRASAHWRRAIPLRLSVTMSNHLDVGILSGPVESVAVVGDRGRCVCEQWFELLAFKTGEHVIRITVRDSADREITHAMPFVVQHERE